MKLASAFNCTLVVAALALTVSVQAGTLLCAPTDADNASFRSQVRTWIGGSVDYYDAATGTPSLGALLHYDAVFTWVNYPYRDSVAMGDVLADYVDAGGRVILGAWCYPVAYNHLDGRIMDDPSYCPVAALADSWAEYSGGGADCIHRGVASYHTIPVSGLQPDAAGDGLLADGWASVWRGDRAIYFSGAATTDSEYVRLVANMVRCEPAPLRGDVNCDGAINVFDIDNFVFVLTITFPPDPWPYCGEDYSVSQGAADVNCDGVVNVFDIDPFVQCLVGDCPPCP